MPRLTLKIHPADNLIVALQDLPAGAQLKTDAGELVLSAPVPAKHKFTDRALAEGATVVMYGVPVGRCLRPIPAGGRVTVNNVAHAAADYAYRTGTYAWTPPPVDRFRGRTFDGYHRPDGRVGTRNYWLVIPLVFCENRNIRVIREAMLEKLGYGGKEDRFDVDRLVTAYRGGAGAGQILETQIVVPSDLSPAQRPFPNVDGIKFLTHEGGCGGTRQDAETLCRLFAGYLTHPNVAGGTVLSLGCQNAQIKLLRSAIAEMNPDFAKPLYFLEQQAWSSEREFVADAIRQTFVGLMEADTATRRPAGLEHLCLGLECGGSDGFSGISANPVLGHVSDQLVALGGKAMLAEFPELNGVEQELLNRCVDADKAEKFAGLMRAYAHRAEAVGSGFHMNPSPGNIRDGLITDAMKSAGAAKKGGSSPVADVLDYTERAVIPGLSLLCTPGNDVESTTGLAASGANLIVFTTGLGTPTGNPIAPVVKLASNTALAERMPEIIDFDAGPVVTGNQSISERGEALLEHLIEVASGRSLTRAERLGQDDFIPWKRGISL